MDKFPFHKLVTLVLASGVALNFILYGYSRIFIPTLLKFNKTENVTQVILLWTSFFGHNDYYFGMGQQPFVEHGCPVHNCELTDNRSRLDESHAVVFHSRDMTTADLPAARKMSQFWIFFLLESPIHTYGLNEKVYRGFFNWTMTYRLDSDIPAPYGRAVELNGTAQNLTNFNERKLVTWLVSNCHTQSKREDYAKQLRKHIEVDEFGGCSGRGCDGDCQNALYSQYKFYLSFENSLCRDYVTERFYQALQHPIVPVVYGLANYSLLAPPHSFIDARDFESPKELAQFLLFLSANETAYVSYFDWKANFVIDINVTKYFCKLCEKLHNEKVPRIYQDIYKWWFNGDENSDKQICSSNLFNNNK